VHYKAVITLPQYDRTGSLDTFLTKIQRIASYLHWDDEDMFRHLCASLCATTADIVRLLQTSYGTQLQVEHFKVELHARRRAPGESLQQLYQDISRLVTLAYSSAKASLVTHVGKEAFIAAVNNGKVQLEVMKQEAQKVEAALSHAIKLEAFEQSPACQDTMVNHTICRPCSVCTVTGLSEAGETPALCELIGDKRSTLAQAARRTEALANGLWSGHTAPSEATSSVGSRCCFNAASTGTWAHSC